ncbi:DNA polymerase III subunit beta [Chloroflexus islandicus]|uniref:DNA polymerase III subunit beta n=1 Tax=Chloroflexus islandicus TaxID=1707952 RepID=A0A178MFG3_9CHLR|nr:nucleotidyltransferase domain-containing protein [Chloroflexus islandicus]OAN47313.1 DNA polymerase III subunit beta [Chloroflexus islandicus]
MTAPLHPTLDHLAGIFARFPAIQAVYLFGSAATGSTHAESDLDLALVLRRDEPTFSKLDLLAALAQAGFCNVDVVVLNTAGIVLRHEVIRHNKLIYQTSDFDHGSFFSLVTRQFLDFRPYLDVQRQAYKARMQHDQTRSTA